MRRRLRALVREVLAQHRSPPRMAAAVGTGLFLGTLPLYGVHLPLCLLAAHLLRLNKVVVYAAANVSNPLVAPLLVAGGLVLGEWMRFGRLRPLDLGQAEGFLSGLYILGGEVPDRFLSCLLGDAVLGAVLGVLGAAVTWRLLRPRHGRAPVAPGRPAPPAGGPPPEAH